MLLTHPADDDLDRSSQKRFPADDAKRGTVVPQQVRRSLLYIMGVETREVGLAWR